MQLAEGLELVAAPVREDPRDVLCGAGSLDELPEGARIGTVSLRRRSQVLARRPDLQMVELRGNVDTPAAQALRRRGRLDHPRGGRPGPAWPPRRRRRRTGPRPGTRPGHPRDRGPHRRRGGPQRGLSSLRDPGGRGRADVRARARRRTRRRLLHPVGAYAQSTPDGGLLLRAYVGAEDGSSWLTDEVGGDDAALARPRRGRAGCAPQAPRRCWAGERVRLSRRRRTGRPGTADRASDRGHRPRRRRALRQAHPARR